MSVSCANTACVLIVNFKLKVHFYTATTQAVFSPDMHHDSWWFSGDCWHPLSLIFELLNWKLTQRLLPPRAMLTAIWIFWHLCSQVRSRYGTDHRSIYTYLDTGLPSLSIDKMRAPQTHLSCPACITLTHVRQPNLSSALLVLPAGLARMRHRENRRDRKFMLGNSRTKLPARCMLGRRGEFEGLADWLSMLPLWDRRTKRRTGKTHTMAS